MNKRFPLYPDDADYQTNAPSYYEDLARKQKLIKMLAEKIWDYDERLDERLEDLENVLQDYLAQWDERIENLDDEVSHIFVTWLNDGTLEQIINHDVLGNKADQSELDKTNELLEQIEVSITTFGGSTLPNFDNSEIIQSAIDYVESKGGGTVLIPEGTFSCANVLLKSKVNIRGNGYNSILKLLPNAHTKSINGSDKDQLGNFAGNVLATTLDHTGGAWESDTRAYDPNNSEYIVSNCTISDLLIDGNKTENVLGDIGWNASAMGACISLNQASHITVRNCKMINARLDGLFVGYSLHGGSDYCLFENCEFEGNIRCGVAQVTGKHNTFRNLIVNEPNATMAAFDIEANLPGEVNISHIVDGCYINGRLAMVAKDPSIQGHSRVVNNYITGTLSLAPANTSQGTIISNNVFQGDNTNDLLSLDGWAYEEKDLNTQPIIFSQNICKGYKNILSDITKGGHGFIDFIGNDFTTSGGFILQRPYKVNIIDNTFRFSGGLGIDESFVTYHCNNSDVIAYQGKVLVKGNTITGDGLQILIKGVSGYLPTPRTQEPFIRLDNNFIDVSVSGTTLITSHLTLSMRDNIIKKMKRLNVDSYLVLENNDIEFSTYDELFIINTDFKDFIIKSNTFRNAELNLTRPKNGIVDSNILKNGRLSTTYSFTSAGAGNNTITNNTILSLETALPNAVEIIIGDEFNLSDLTEDTYIGNTHSGLFTTLVNIELSTMPIKEFNNSFSVVRDTLPTASISYRGMIKNKRIEGVDVPHICINNNGIYEWKPLFTETVQ